MERLASLDAGFLTLESRRAFTHIGSVTVLDRAVTFDALRTRIAERLHLLPPFRRRLVEVPLGLGQPYWAEDPDFDLDFHVRETALPAPGDGRRFAETIARLFSIPLDRTRPLWEIWLVQGVDGDRSAMITKIHHAAVDGVSGTEALGALLDGGGEDDDFGWEGERIPSELELVARGLVDLALAPTRTLLAAPTLLRNLSALPGNGSPPPPTPFGGEITAHRRFAWGDLSLSRVKAIKDAAGVTVNDVVVTLCAASARTFLSDIGELPDDPLVAAIPTSVRSDEDEDYGNRIGMLSAPVATHIEDPLERLHWTAASLHGAKDAHGDTPAVALLDAAHPVPPAIASLVARATLNGLSRLRPPLNLLVSNVPGPPETLHLLGAEVDGIYPVPPIVDGLGLNITVVSYRDHLGVGLMTDRDQVDDAWPLLDGLEAALDELEAAVV